MDIAAVIVFLRMAVANPIVAGALSGWGAAALADYQTFRGWKSVDEALAYGWGLAFWRWFQGAITGALTGAGISVAAL